MYRHVQKCWFLSTGKKKQKTKVNSQIKMPLKNYKDGQYKPERYTKALPLLIPIREISCLSDIPHQV